MISYLYFCLQRYIIYPIPPNKSSKTFIFLSSISNHYLPPPQVIHPKHRLPQSLFRITSHESHHSLQLPHPMLNHSSILKFLPLSSYCPKLPPCIISANNFFPSFSFGSHSNHGPSLISNRSSVINTCSPPSSACGPPFPPHIPREQHHQSKIINH